MEGISEVSSLTAIYAGLKGSPFAKEFPAVSLGPWVASDTDRLPLDIRTEFWAERFVSD